MWPWEGVRPSRPAVAKVASAHAGPRQAGAEGASSQGATWGLRVRSEGPRLCLRHPWESSVRRGREEAPGEGPGPVSGHGPSSSGDPPLLPPTGVREHLLCARRTLSTDGLGPV